MTDKNVAALHIRGEKKQILSVLSRFSARQRSLATLRKDRAFGMRIIGSDHRDRTDQDYKDYDNMTAITSSPKVFLHFVGTFLSVYVSERIRVRAAFLQEKISWKRKRENNKSKEKRMYRNRGCGERETTRRERSRVDLGRSIIAIRGVRLAREENDQKGSCDATWLLSFSSHCSPLSLLFTFPVPRSPFSELHAPNPTSDPHKGRRGRDTCGKSSSTPLQRIRRVSEIFDSFDMFAFLTA